MFHSRRIGPKWFSNANEIFGSRESSNESGSQSFVSISQ